MNVKDWLTQAQRQFENTGIATARLDAMVLLEDETSKDRSWLLAHPEHELQRSEMEILHKKCIQRANHTPLAYIRGKTEFYGREFVINEHVLEPRPESETMIELLLSLTLPNDATIADVGTGSGALAVTAALQLPASLVYATDIDEKCLGVAKVNNALHGTGVQFYAGNLIDALPQSAHLSVLLCNLPYIPDSFQINTAATHEPRIAIFGGPDGLDYFRTLFSQIDQRALKPIHVLTESLPTQHDKLVRIAENHGYQQVTDNDFIQIFTNQI